MKKIAMGNVTHVRMNLTDPIVCDYDMDINQLTILTGANGVGKTLLLKIIWCLSTIANHALIVRDMKIPGFNAVEQAQYIFDNSFDNQNFDGTIDVDYGNSGSSIKVVFELGKILDVKSYFPEEVEPGNTPLFMSKDTRLMSDVVKYLKIKKMFALPAGIPTDMASMGQLLEYNKLYDIIYLEKLLLLIESKTTPDVIKRFNDQILNFDSSFSIQAVRIDYSKPDLLYIDSKGIERSTQALGAGHQSLFGMVLMHCY